MTETAAPLSRYGSWSARVRRGFHSDNRLLAVIIRLLDIGGCPRPVVRWSAFLLMCALLGTGLTFLDGFFTAVVLLDPGHPFAAEAWGPTAKLIELFGVQGLVIIKFAQAALLFFILDLARLRGLRVAIVVLSLLFTLISGFLVLNSLDILLSGPLVY